MAAEPFRLFFPLAVLAGVMGTLLWPLHFGGWAQTYPGTSHARLMAHGFFGSFILGFLATALPRLLSVPRLRTWEVSLLLLLQGSLVAAHSLALTRLGDLLFIFILLAFGLALAGRWRQRQDLPPPGFILILPAWISGFAGAGLALARVRFEEVPWIPVLEPLLYYQGFILFPILGVSGFMLPRLLGFPSRYQDLPESRTPLPGWWGQASQAALLGALILLSFALETGGHPRWGHALRLACCAGWMLREIPFFRKGTHPPAFARALHISLFCLGLGFLAAVLFPHYRVANLHLTLMGGFAVLTLTVATRVVFGHTGQRSALQGRNRWFAVVIIMALLAMATRMSGDFWPAIMKSHYNYGAALWILALGLWARYVLIHIRKPDPEDDG